MALSRRRNNRFLRYVLYGASVSVILWCLVHIVIQETDWQRIGDFRQFIGTLKRYLPPDFSILPALMVPAVETFMISVWGTILAVIMALPVACFGARNITPYLPVTYPLGRAVMTLSRSIHEIVWALIFVAALGLGAFPGILAIGVRSIGFMAKLTAEDIEDIDIGQVEAIKSTGANRVQVFLFGIVPQILPTFIGNAIFQWDINIRRAAIMGVVGAGGLGLVFHQQMSMFNYAGVTTVIIALLGLVIVGEAVSYGIRKTLV